MRDEYLQIIPKRFLNLPKFGFINVHASLLPKWRGASPVQHALMNNDKETGYTFIIMNERLDEGKIVDQGVHLSLIHISEPTRPY